MQSEEQESASGASLVFGKEMARGGRLDGWMDGSCLAGSEQRVRELALTPGAAAAINHARQSGSLRAARAHEPRSLHTLMMHKKVVPDPD